ncbi:hypothetical protein, partial [Clostridioides difficile]
MNNIADQSELSDESQEKISGEEIINLIKENLGKKYFSSHKDMIEFLKNKGIRISQPRISYYLNKYNIHKNKIGYYEDFSANARDSLLKEIFLKSNVKIYEPKVYGVNVDSNTKNDSLFFIFIKIDLGYENFLCELLSNYFSKEFSYLVGHGCIQI